jgi:hypothetical protein
MSLTYTDFVKLGGKMADTASDFPQTVKDRSELDLFARRRVLVVTKASDQEKVYENTPKDKIDPKDEFWSHRVNTDIPKQYIDQAPVNVSYISF